MSLEAMAKGGRRIPGWKLGEVEELSRLISGHRVIAVFKLTGLRANLIHEVRKILKGAAILRVTKRNLLKKAAEKAGKPELIKLVEDIKEPVGFIFSNISAFRLKIILDKSRIPMHAKAGEKADFDVVIPEMNTGLPPGPVLSDFAKLRIPTRIEGGQIWIAKDTVVARRGEEISPALAALLARLDIRAVLKGVSVERAFEDGVLLTKEQLEIDLEKIKEDLLKAHGQALTLATEIDYITRETIVPLLLRAYAHARTLALEAAIPSKEIIGELLLRAEVLAWTLKEAVKLS